MSLQRLRMLAVLLTALALVPVGAHLLEMPSKLALSRDDYLTVQAIYRGWALLGAVLIGAVAAADLTLAVSLRHDRRAAALALAGGLLMAATLVVFFVWVFPTNQSV